MNVSIDKKSGFCFGVVYAIEAAEKQLEQHGELYCLGDIVHNEREVERLKAKGLITINHEQFKELRNARVLIRAHGEPPSTYQTALENGIELVDASCPVVLKLQNRVKKGFDKMVVDEGQVVIFGKKGHAEVKGLVGQTGGEAIVVMDDDDLDSVDYSRPIQLFSQTTIPKQRLAQIYAEIKHRSELALGEARVTFNDTTCRQVSNREPELRKFAHEHDVVIFVSGQQSSNGRTLHGVCAQENPNSFFVSDLSDIRPEWFAGVRSVGIAGATSTPLWLMEQVQHHIEGLEA